jgi:hypothetical protein
MSDPYPSPKALAESPSSSRRKRRPQRAAGQLRGYYVAAGAAVEVSSNSPLVIQAAGQVLGRLEHVPSRPDGHLQFNVDERDASQPPWPKPYFAGLDHLVFAGLSPSCALLLDVRRCRGLARLCPGMARDTAYWSSLIFPVVLGILGPSMGIVPLHCACVVRPSDQAGLLLAGGSGVGKSTLAVALAKLGFALLSDDWTYFTLRDGCTSAWGLPTPVKLLPDAGAHFGELARQRPTITLNGEPAFEVDPVSTFSVSRSLRCEPRWVLFLEREPGARCRARPVAAQQAVTLLDGDTPQWWPELEGRRRAVIATLSQCRCLALRHGASPHEAAQFIAGLVDALHGGQNSS